MSEETTPQRRVYEPLDDDFIQRLDMALEHTRGHQSHAAIVMGIKPSRIRYAVNTNPTLQMKWGRGERKAPPAPSLENNIDRPPPLLSPEQVRVVKATENQDALLQGDWADALGYDPDSRNFLQALQTNYASNLRGTMDLAFGGAAHATTKLLLLFEDLHRRIEHIDENPEEYERVAFSKTGDSYIVKSAHEFRTELYDRLIRVSGELRKMNNDLTNANKTRLIMLKLAQESQNEIRKKAGWEPKKADVEESPKAAPR